MLSAETLAPAAAASAAAAAADADAEQLLHDLVAVPSPSGQEDRAARLLVGWMAAHSYDRAFVDEAGNAVGLIGDGPRDVILLGHIDTFPGGPPVRLDGRTLYGRGTVDAKGPLCAFAAAAARADLPDGIRLVVIGAVGEEAPGSVGARHALTLYRPAACLIGEPSRWDRVTLGYKGRLLVDWRWEEALAHSAGQAVTPAERAAACWEAVRAHAAAVNAGREGVFRRLDARLERINSGTGGSCGWAEITVGFRLPPDVPPGRLADELRALPQGDGAAVTVYGAEVAHLAGRDTLLSRALRGAIRAAGGGPRFVHKTGTSDMNVVGPAWGCPIAAYGPGDSALDHTPDEHLDLDEYRRAIAVLTDALGRLRLDGLPVPDAL